MVYNKHKQTHIHTHMHTHGHIHTHTNGYLTTHTVIFGVCSKHNSDIKYLKHLFKRNSQHIEPHRGHINIIIIDKFNTNNSI